MQTTEDTFEVDVVHYQAAEMYLSATLNGVARALTISRLAALTITLQPLAKMLRLDTADSTRPLVSAHLRALADLIDTAPGCDVSQLTPVLDRMQATGNAILAAQPMFNSEYISDGETKQ